MRLSVIKWAFDLIKMLDKFKTKLSTLANVPLQVFLNLASSKTLLEQISNKQLEIEKKNNLLLEKRGEFKNLLDNFPDGVLIHRDGIILYTNPRLREYLKYEQSFEMLGQSVYDIMVPPEFVDIVKKRTQDLISGVVAVNPLMEFELLTKISGERFSCEVSSVPMTIDGDKCVAVTFRDLSDRKKLQIYKMTTDRMTALGHLAAGVGHEINNPLCYVMMNLELVKDNLAAAKIRDYNKQISAIQKGLERIKTVVSDLKTVSRVSPDNAVTHVDVNDVIESVLGIVKNEIQHRAVLKCSLTSVEPIWIEETRLAQILINLAINAAHSIPIGDTNQNCVGVKTFMNNKNQVVIEISDTGSGMSKDIQKKIFDPFFTTKAAGKGTGLGLSICHNIVNQFNGTIEFKSELGKGTVFQVVFPASEATKNIIKLDQAEMKKDSKAASKGQVLIIDDDVELLDVLQEIVSTNHDCLAFTNAQAALDILKENNTFDCIICDLMMPKMSGLQFYNALKQTAPHYLNRVIILTGGSFTEETDNFLNLPEITVLEKPIDTTLLLKAIQSFVIQNSSNGLVNLPIKKAG